MSDGTSENAKSFVGRLMTPLPESIQRELRIVQSVQAQSSMPSLQLTALGFSMPIAVTLTASATCFQVASDPLLVFVAGGGIVTVVRFIREYTSPKLYAFIFSGDRMVPGLEQFGSSYGNRRVARD